MATDQTPIKFTFLKFLTFPKVQSITVKSLSNSGVLWDLLWRHCLFHLTSWLYGDKCRAVPSSACSLRCTRQPKTEGCESLLNHFSWVTGKSLPGCECDISHWVKDTQQPKPPECNNSHTQTHIIEKLHAYKSLIASRNDSFLWNKSDISTEYYCNMQVFPINSVVILVKSRLVIFMRITFAFICKRLFALKTGW